MTFLRATAWKICLIYYIVACSLDLLEHISHLYILPPKLCSHINSEGGKETHINVMNSQIQRGANAPPPWLLSRSKSECQKARSKSDLDQNIIAHRIGLFLKKPGNHCTWLRLPCRYGVPDWHNGNVITLTLWRFSNIFREVVELIVR